MIILGPHVLQAYNTHLLVSAGIKQRKVNFIGTFSQYAQSG